MRRIQASALLILLLALDCVSDSVQNYTVVHGDTLSDVVGMNMLGPIYSKKGSLHKLLKLNPNLKKNSKLIPGQKIKLMRWWREEKKNRERLKRNSKKPHLKEKKFSFDVRYAPSFYQIRQQLLDTSGRYRAWGVSRANIKANLQYQVSSMFSLGVEGNYFMFSNDQQDNDMLSAVHNSLSTWNGRLMAKLHLRSSDFQISPTVGVVVHHPPYFTFMDNVTLQLVSHALLGASFGLPTQFFYSDKQNGELVLSLDLLLSSLHKEFQLGNIAKRVKIGYLHRWRLNPSWDLTGGVEGIAEWMKYSFNDDDWTSLLWNSFIEVGLTYRW